MSSLAGMEWWQVIAFGFLFHTGWWLLSVVVYVLGLAFNRGGTPPKPSA